MKRLLFPFLIILLFLSRQSLLEYQHEPGINLPPPHITHFTFGFAEQMADQFWVRVIQDFDYCEQKIAENTCRNQGWLYQMLDLITDLSPNFRMPHATGPLALTVIISDIEGASKLFDKAVKNFPKDWPILYRAAYQALSEEKNKEKAADLLYRAAKYGAPSWAYTLAGRLYSEAGAQELGERIYQEIDQDPNMKDIAKRLRGRLDGKKVPTLLELENEQKKNSKESR
ncbi:MAG: hypothetical protein AABY64_14845 [Bdellovibrionota bacterium]